jgi:hypothetical protein
VLNTDYNLTIETMVRIADALGASVSLHLHSNDTAVKWSETQVERVRRAHSARHICYPSRNHQDVPVVADRPASRPRRRGRGK